MANEPDSNLDHQLITSGQTQDRQIIANEPDSNLDHQRVTPGQTQIRT